MTQTSSTRRGGMGKRTVTVVAGQRRPCNATVGSALSIPPGPWINNFDPALRHVRAVTRDDCQRMDCGSGCDKTVDDGHRPAESFRVCLHFAPARGNGCIDGKDAAGETFDQVTFEPGLQAVSLCAWRQAADTFSQFAQRQHTEVQAAFVACPHPLDKALVGAWLHQFRQDAGIQQVIQSFSFLPVSRGRSMSI